MSHVISLQLVAISTTIVHTQWFFTCISVLRICVYLMYTIAMRCMHSYSDISEDRLLSLPMSGSKMQIFLRSRPSLQNSQSLRVDGEALIDKAPVPL